MREVRSPRKARRHWLPRGWTRTIGTIWSVLWRMSGGHVIGSWQGGGSGLAKGGALAPAPWPAAGSNPR
jgi:hypothetical protein